VEQEWFFHWDKAPVRTSTIIQNWLTTHSVQALHHLPYLPDLSLADFFLFLCIKNKLADVSLVQDTLKTEWEGVMRTIIDEEFTNPSDSRMRIA
jgi:hypothetical protein